MNEQKYSILLVTNGMETTRPSLEYGAWMASLLKVPVVLLGLQVNVNAQNRLRALLEETERRLLQAGVEFQTRLETGGSTDRIAAIAGEGNYLVIVGPLGRPAWQRAVQGRSFRRLLAKIETPILYVPQVCLPLRRMLICTGGLAYAHSVEHMGFLLAKAAGAEVSLLHVVEPINLDYPTAHQVQAHWEQILETDTPQGRNLRLAIEEMQSVGLKVNFKVRHGSVVHEILAEIHAGDYDLIGLGSPYSAKSLRHLYTPNVTAEVAEAAHLPVLAVRMGQALWEKISFS